MRKIELPALGDRRDQASIALPPFTPCHAIGTNQGIHLLFCSLQWEWPWNLLLATALRLHVRDAPKSHAINTLSVEIVVTVLVITLCEANSLLCHSSGVTAQLTWASPQGQLQHRCRGLDAESPIGRAPLQSSQRPWEAKTPQYHTWFHSRVWAACSLHILEGEAAAYLSPILSLPGTQVKEHPKSRASLSQVGERRSCHLGIYWLLASEPQQSITCVSGRKQW